MATIFISYSHANRDFVRRLRDDLAKNGHSVRYDADASGEPDLPHWLDEWRSEADVHIAVLTPRYLQSKLPLQELAGFLQSRQHRGTTLIPLLLERVPLPESLLDTNAIDFTGGYGPALDRLISALAEVDASRPPGTFDHLQTQPGTDTPAAQSAATSDSATDTATGEPAAAPLPPSAFPPGPEGLAAYEQHLAGFPDHPAAQRERAQVLADLGRSSEALAIYDEIIQRFPDEVDAGSRRAALLEALERFPEAGPELSGGGAQSGTQPAAPDPGASGSGAIKVQVPKVDADQVAQQAPSPGTAESPQSPPGTPEPSPAPPAAPVEPAASAPPPFSVAPASISDQPAALDALGFEPYVRAVAEFLTNEGTRPPLTLSIEGEWGSGKSSFMQQLQRAIQARQTAKGREAAVTVWFNPWRHDREEAVWAAFALEFLRGVSEQLPFAERWRGHFRLLHRRFAWRDGWLDIIRAFLAFTASLAAIGIVAYVMLADGGARLVEFRDAIAGDGADKGLLTVLLGAGGIFGSLAVAITLWKQAKSFIGNPLRFDLKRYVQSPDYQSRISFIEHFHQDFGRIVKAYVGERKVFVFIDDLDRCQTPKAADLMQALNLMMGAGEQPIVFILGMDREKIAASLAVKFKDLLPYVTADPARAGKIDDGEAALRGLEYGSEFIEKFVQLSFRIPQPGDSDVATLLRSISGDGKAPAPRPGQAAAPASSPSIPRLTQIPVDSTGPVRPRAGGSVRETGFSRPRPADEPVRAALQEEVAVDSERLHEIVRMVAPALDYNPRRIKQFVNVFRLKAYVAIATGLIGSRPQDLTFEKLGKFVALGLRWPLLMTDLDNERDLLERLQARTLGQVHGAISGAEAFWFRRPRLLELLRVGLTDREGNSVTDEEPVYSMKGLSMGALLEVAAPPPVRVAPPEPAPSAVQPVLR